MDLKMHLKMHFFFKCILNAFKNGKFFPKGCFEIIIKEGGVKINRKKSSEGKTHAITQFILYAHHNMVIF